MRSTGRMTMKDKGATEFDKLCHRVFEAKDGEEYLARKAGAECGNCGTELMAYYCESRLYLVKCDCCGIMALVTASSQSDAAYRTFGDLIYATGD